MQGKPSFGNLVDWDLDDRLDRPLVGRFGKATADSEVEHKWLQVDVDRAVDAIVLLVPGLDVAELAEIRVILRAERDSFHDLAVEFDARHEFGLPAREPIGEVPVQDRVEGKQPILALVADDGT